MDKIYFNEMQKSISLKTSSVCKTKNKENRNCAYPNSTKQIEIEKSSAVKDKTRREVEIRSCANNITKTEIQHEEARVQSIETSKGPFPFLSFFKLISVELRTQSATD